MSFQDYIREAFAPVSVPPDRPGDPPRAHLFQTPSDRMRDRATEFAKLLIGLVPEPSYHAHIVDTLHDLVVGGEQALQAVLEDSPEAKRHGHRFELKHAPKRVQPAHSLESQERIAHGLPPSEPAAEQSKTGKRTAK